VRAERDLGIDLVAAATPGEAFRLLNRILLLAKTRGFPLTAITNIQAHESLLIRLAHNLDDSKSAMLKVTMKAVRSANPRTIPEKKPLLDATSMMDQMTHHGDLRRMKTEPLNEMGLPSMIMFVGTRMVDCYRMSWDHAKRCARILPCAPDA
jgi:hypothetical protein